MENTTKQDIVRWTTIKELHSEEQLEDLRLWLVGQTVPLDGIWRCDYERWRDGFEPVW